MSSTPQASIPQPGDLILIRGSGLLGWAIRKVTRASVSHVYVVDETGAAAYEATGAAGVHRSVFPDLSEPTTILRPFPNDASRLVVTRSARMRLGRRYNFFIYPELLLRFFFHFTEPRLAFKRFYTCSQLAVTCWREAGVDPVPGVPADLVAPGDLLVGAS